MKILKEARKGEEGNVIQFELAHELLATAPKPPGKDWLRSLPQDCRFICRPLAQPGQIVLPWFGIASIEEKAILLATDGAMPGHLKFDWVDSANFSKQNVLVQLLPELKQEEGKPPEEG